MKTSTKIIKFISSLLIVLGISLCCCLEISVESSSIDPFKIYSLLIFMVLLGCAGLKISTDPHFFFRIIYGFGYSIVNNIRIRFTYNRFAYNFRENSLIARYLTLYDEGVDIYERKHR